MAPPPSLVRIFRAFAILSISALCFSVQASSLTPHRRDHHYHLAQRAHDEREPVHLETRADKSYDVTVSPTSLHDIPKTLYGLFVEDYRHAVDGGLYAELLQNRALQKQGADVTGTERLYPWRPTGSAELSIAHLDHPVSKALPKSFNLTVPKGKTGGLGQWGYWGIHVEQGFSYNLSFYVRSSHGFDYSNAPLVASLRSHAEDKTYATKTITVKSLTTSWQQINTTLTVTGGTPPGRIANFSLHLDAGAKPFNAHPQTELYFALFTLMNRDTYNRDYNGHRKDLAEAAIAMKPGFWRWPAGNNMEGQTIATRWIWNKTIGPLVDRPGRDGTWGYPNTDGEGVLEMLKWTRQADITRLMSVYAGYSTHQKHVKEANIGPYVQSAVNFVNFVTGDASDKSNHWAQIRSQLGHPAPYPFTYLEIGNEDYLDESGSYSYRWNRFATRLQNEFPDMKLIATTHVGEPKLSPAPKYYDQHFYNTPRFFIDAGWRYDHANAERNGTKFATTEYAVVSTDEACYNQKPRCHRKTPHTMVAASAEAVFTIGLERNSDIVFAGSYGITYQNKAASLGWTTDLVNFNATDLVKSTAYWYLHMFHNHVGDVLLKTTVPKNDGNGVIWSATEVTSSGKVFIKLANAKVGAAKFNFDLSGFSTVASTGSLIILHGPGANNFTHPHQVEPKTRSIDTGKSFSYTLPAHAVAVLVVNTSGSSSTSSRQVKVKARDL